MVLLKLFVYFPTEKNHNENILSKIFWDERKIQQSRVVIYNI